jgi:ankyrin repeat protein
MERWLLDNCFPVDGVNCSGANGVTPLMKAGAQGNIAMLRKLIASGAELNAVNGDGNNVIWLACASGCLEAIELLVSAGANINHRNPDGATALIYAASAGKGAVVEKLLRLGADPTPLTLDGFSALDLASTLECLATLRADTRSRGINAASPMHRVAESHNSRNLNK